ncbi:unnamed protein product [Rotaria socialis]
MKSCWSFLERKTNLKRENIALGMLGFLVIYLAFGWGNDFVCDLIGFLYPVYASMLVIEMPETFSKAKWSIYWIIYASLGLAEYFRYAFTRSLPLYWLGKCIFLIWLMLCDEKTGICQRIIDRLRSLRLLVRCKHDTG